MEREQNSVDFKEESTLEQAPESLRSVLLALTLERPDRYK